MPPTKAIKMMRKRTSVQHTALLVGLDSRVVDCNTNSMQHIVRAVFIKFIKSHLHHSCHHILYV